MNIGDHAVSARSIVLELRNVSSGVTNSYICIYRELGLRTQSAIAMW